MSLLSVWSGRLRIILKASQAFFSPQRLFPPALELCPAGMSPVPLDSEKNQPSHNSLSDLVDGIWMMAAPKSKVSNMKKKRKHLRYIPKPKQWSTCVKCGEPKLPHRICKKHLEVCAMREDEWNEKQLELKKTQESA